MQDVRALASRSHQKAGRSFSSSIERAELDRSYGNTQSGPTGRSRCTKPELPLRRSSQQSSKDVIPLAKSAKPEPGRLQIGWQTCWRNISRNVSRPIVLPLKSRGFCGAKLAALGG